jgi:hypothetical protein
MTYTIDLQRLFLSDTLPVILDAALQDIVETDSGPIAVFGPRFGLGSLYLRLKVRPSELDTLVRAPRYMFGQAMFVAVQATTISRPLFTFRTKNRSDKTLPPSLEIDIGDIFVIEGSLMGWAIDPGYQ